MRLDQKENRFVLFGPRTSTLFSSERLPLQGAGPSNLPASRLWFDTERHTINSPRPQPSGLVGITALASLPGSTGCRR